MKRLSAKIELKRKAGGLTRSTAGPMLRKTRTVLGFVDPEPNPLAGVQAGKTQDVTFKRQLDAVGLAFRAASKSIKGDQLHEHTGYGAEYFCMIFQDAGQATAFLKGIGYPQPMDTYVDGLIVADLLNVTLPEPQVAPKKLKAVHNPKLTRLAKPL